MAYVQVSVWRVSEQSENKELRHQNRPIVLGLVIFGALLACLQYLGFGSDPAGPHPHPLYAWMAVLALSMLLFLTTGRWAHWIAPILILLFVRLCALLVLSFRCCSSVSADSTLLLLAYLLGSSLLLARYATRVPRSAERIALVAFVICLCFAIVQHSWLPAGIGELIQVSRVAIQRLKKRPPAGAVANLT